MNVIFSSLIYSQYVHSETTKPVDSTSPSKLAKPPSLDGNRSVGSRHHQQKQQNWQYRQILMRNDTEKHI